MRINRADIDLWRAHELQSLRRPSETSSPGALEKRPEPAPRRPTGSRRRLIGRTASSGAIAPLDDQLADTAGNVAILRHLIDCVLPTLPMPDDVRQLAVSLFAEDMNHHLRVLHDDTGDATESGP